jgi:uncharacterized protein YuzB (UPF0349 family)
VRRLPAWYQESRKGVEDYFKPSNLITEDHPVIVYSPSKKYFILIEKYSIPDAPSFSRGKVFNASTNQLIADVKRNHQHFMYCWVTLNRKEYLLCGEDYQGHTVIDLAAKNVYNYIDENALEGLGFCWQDIHPSPDGRLLVVEGSYFPGLKTVVVYDFSNPTKLPLPKLQVIDTRLPWGFDVGEWTDNETIKLYHKKGVVYYHTPTGKLEDIHEQTVEKFLNIN